MSLVSELGLGRCACSLSSNLAHLVKDCDALQLHAAPAAMLQLCPSKSCRCCSFDTFVECSVIDFALCASSVHLSFVALKLWVPSRLRVSIGSLLSLIPVHRKIPVLCRADGARLHNGA